MVDNPPGSNANASRNKLPPIGTTINSSIVMDKPTIPNIISNGLNTLNINLPLLLLAGIKYFPCISLPPFYFPVLSKRGLLSNSRLFIAFFSVDNCLISCSTL